MPYRLTERTERRRAAIRGQVLRDALVADLVAFCLRSVTDRQDTRAGAHAA